MEILIALTILLTTLCVYFNDTKKYFKNLGIVYQSPLPIFGNLLSFVWKRKGIYEFLEKNYQDFKNEKLIGIFGIFNRPFMIVTDPAMIYKITVKDSHYFVNHDHNHNIEIDRLLDKSVMMMRDQEWKDMRSLLNPIFSSSMMKYMFGLAMDANVNFWKRIELKAEKNGGKIEVDTLKTFSRITANTIVTTTLGFHYDYDEDQDGDVKRLTNRLLHDFSDPKKFALISVFPRLFKLLGIKFFHPSIHEFFLDRVVKEVQLRTSGDSERPDIIQLLVQARQKQDLTKSKNLKLTDEDLVAQALVFFVAGFDTTTALLQALSFELSSNPEVQEKLLNEVDEVLEQLEGKKISYEQLNSLKYLDMVISEGLRKWPSTRITVRACNADYELVDDESGKVYKIEQGSDLMFLHGAMQNDERFFQNPEVFDPERFSEKNKENFPSRAYSPFGHGPRYCIGKRFAIMEVKIMLFEFCSKFVFEKSKNTPENLQITKGIVGFEGEIFVGFKLRNFSK